MSDSTKIADMASAAELEKTRHVKGLAAGLGAFILWGVFPLYFKFLKEIPVLELMSHRIIWSLVFVIGIIAVTGRFVQLKEAISNRKTVMVFLATTTLIAINWVTFVWAITNDHVLEASLGYYINPLVNVVLGMLFLGEKLNKWQGSAIALAATAVILLTVQVGAVPWVSLTLAFSFGFYGLFRKKVQVESVVGLTIETALLTPICLAFMGFLIATDNLQGGQNNGGFYELPIFGLLVVSGLITAIPLILFSYGAQRLKLATVGVLQYIAPTIQAIMAVYLFDEEFSSAQGMAFGLIWIGLMIYTFDAIRSVKRR
jgi:chloramphenicol-sensitive protein RarD